MLIKDFIDTHKKYCQAYDEWHNFYPKFWKNWLEVNDLLLVDAEGNGSPIHIYYDNYSNEWCLTVLINNIFGEHPFHCETNFLDGSLTVCDYDTEYNDSGKAFPYVKFEFGFTLTSEFSQWLSTYQPKLMLNSTFIL